VEPDGGGVCGTFPGRPIVCEQFWLIVAPGAKLPPNLTLSRHKLMSD
jgi:hypothetical protein